MTTLRSALLVTSAAACMLAAARVLGTPAPLQAESVRCTFPQASTRAVLRVERDTTLPAISPLSQPMSYSGVPRSADSLLATPDTPMPGARVRLLQLDSATRAELRAAGVTDSTPTAYIIAAPYRADCRTIRWTSAIPFAVTGETGYVRANLAPRERWVGDAPLLVIPAAWSYPYPRKRGQALFGVSPDAPLISADAMFSLESALEMPATRSGDAWREARDARSGRALAWAVANPATAELEPARTLIRRAVLDPDCDRARSQPSRLRGSWRVVMEAGGARSTWFFRTHDRPGYAWLGMDTLTTAELVRSPHCTGYRIVGVPAPSHDSLVSVPPAPSSGRRAIAWLAAADRPTAPGNEARRTLPALLEFTLESAPELLWDALETFVPPVSTADSLWRARTNRPLPREHQQPRFPLTLRLDEGGGVRADTTLSAGGTTIRVQLERMDTLAVRRPF